MLSRYQIFYENAQWCQLFKSELQWRFFDSSVMEWHPTGLIKCSCEWHKICKYEKLFSRIYKAFIFLHVIPRIILQSPLINFLKMEFICKFFRNMHTEHSYLNSSSCFMMNEMIELTSDCRQLHNLHPLPPHKK